MRGLGITARLAGIGVLSLGAAGCIQTPVTAPVALPAAVPGPTPAAAPKASAPVARTTSAPASAPAARTPRPPAVAAARKPAAASARPAKPAAAPVLPPAPPPAAAAPALDLASLEQRLRDTKAIGVFTKLSLKNQVDDLLGRFRDFYGRKGTITLAQLRQQYDQLLLKVLSVLQDGDPALAATISASREAIWGILADPVRFSKLQT